MNFDTARQFRLSSLRNGKGISCDVDGAFVGSVPLLKRAAGDQPKWEPRDADEISEALSAAYGLPIDISVKSGGLSVIARALNTGDVARAQIATLLLQLPDPPALAKDALSQGELVKLAVSLDWAGLLKFNPNHYPAKTPDGKGGQFAPKGEDGGNGVASNFTDETPSVASTASDTADATTSTITNGAARAFDLHGPIPAVATQDADGQLIPVVYPGTFHDQVVYAYAKYLAKAGFTVEAELPLQMADGSASTRIDILAQKGKITIGVEVKTGDDPDVTLPQLIIYPHLIMGGSVISNNVRIAGFGFAPGQLLPPIPVESMYVSGPGAEPEFDDYDPQKLLDELRRRLGRRRGR